MYKRDLKIGLLVHLLALFLTFNSAAIERVSAVGARETALSLAVVALSGSFSVFHNQAFLTENSSSSLSVSYRQPYFIRGYSESALSLVYPTKTAVFAIGYNTGSDCFLQGIKYWNFHCKSPYQEVVGRYSVQLFLP